MHFMPPVVYADEAVDFEGEGCGGAGCCCDCGCCGCCCRLTLGSVGREGWEGGGAGVGVDAPRSPLALALLPPLTNGAGVARGGCPFELGVGATGVAVAVDVAVF